MEHPERWRCALERRGMKVSPPFWFRDTEKDTASRTDRTRDEVVEVLLRIESIRGTVYVRCFRDKWRKAD